MEIPVTEGDREEARRIMERISRGFIDDAEIDAPDDLETAELKRHARERADRRRDAARERAARRRRKASSTA